MERRNSSRDAAVASGTGVIGVRRTEKLSEVIAREIVRDLRDLPPATMLPSEAIMLEKYRTGRASLREALRLLEVQGLIVIRPGPGGGPMVAQVDSQHYGRVSTLYYHMLGVEYQNVVDARLVMEPVVVRIAAERQDPDDILKLKEFVARMKAGPDADHDRYVRDATGFHAMLAGMSGNPVLTLSCRSLQEIYHDRVHGLFPAEEQIRVERDHVTIAQAIIKGDATRAERLMRQHMQEYVDYSKLRYPGLLEETVDWH